MRARALFFALTLAVNAPVAHADYISFTLSIRIGGFTVESNGSATYDCSCIGSYSMTGEHVINDGGAGTVARTSFGPTEGNSYVTAYRGNVSAGTIYEHCYRAAISATGSRGYSNGYGSSMACAPPQPNPPQAITLCDDPARTDGTCSPIVINLESSHYGLAGVDAPVAFDIDADGTLNRLTWTERGSSVRFLVLDRNHNALIDDGAELFGNVRAANGFERLAELDGNHDGLIDAADDAWPALSIWTDSDHDGISQPQELRGVALSGIRAIETAYHWTGRRDANGNFFRYAGTALLSHGRRPIYDVYFRILE